MNLAITYEMDYYIYDQEIILFIKSLKNMQNRNFWKQ